MPESFARKLDRFKFNLFPAYRRTGARIQYISDDYREIHIKIPLNFWTRNYVGTIFGGSMFSATDPIYMVQLIQIIGTDYIVWDKSSVVKFKRPATADAFVTFEFSEAEIANLKQQRQVSA